MALRKKRVPVFLAGVDQKSDPKQVPPGGALTLTNLYQQRTGELVQRNGASALTAAVYANGGLTGLYQGLGGNLLGHAVNWNGGGYPGLLTRYSKLPAVSGWLPSEALEPNDPAGAIVNGYPHMTASVSGWMAPGEFNGNDLSDPDIAFGASAFGVTAVGPTTGAGFKFALFASRDAVAGTLIHSQGGNSHSVAALARPSVMVTGGINNANPSSAYLCEVRLDTTASPYSLWVDNYSGQSPVSTKIVNADVSAAQPWFDAKALNTGAGALTTRFAVIYRATGGGVSVLTFDPSTNTIFGGPNNFPTLDASMALGTLDDAAFPQAPTLQIATAGTTNGVRTSAFDCSAATITFGGQTTIDATVTTGVRQITGYSTNGGSHVAILWDLDASPTYNQSIHIGTWNGSSATSAALFNGNTMGLYSRAFRASDGDYYVVASYDSAAYPAYVVINAARTETAGLLMPGYAGGRRAVTSSLASVATTGGVSYVALTRKQAIGATGGTIVQERSVAVASMTWTAPLRRPRELGGTLFMPGGVVVRDDGMGTAWAVAPIPPESPALAGLTDALTPGHLTLLGTYFYRLVIRSTDATGRVTRSAGSVPVSVTLSGTQNAVNITTQFPGPVDLDPGSALEIYRAGPAGAGSTQYNRVGEQPGYITIGAFTFEDTVSDANAALGELLYSTGNVLENTATPSCNLLEVFGQRVWIVNAEDPTQLWFSKQYVAGSGVGFNSNNVLSITGDGRGAITALAAMDGYLVAFKDSAIYAISGAGPNNLGSGSFNPPQAVSLALGTTNPSSVVHTPDGVMFQSAKGIWLLDRGLSLQPIGAPVETTALAANIVDCSLVSGVPQVRFVFADGTCLVYDYFQKRWYQWALFTGGSTVVACCDSSLYGWCYATADGKVWHEIAGQAFDNTSTQIIPVITTPHLSFAGPGAYVRVYQMDIMGEYVGAHTLKVQFEYDSSGTLSTAQTKAISTPGTYAYKVNPSSQRCSRVKAVVTLAAGAASGGFKISSLIFTVGQKEGENIAYTGRLT